MKEINIGYLYYDLLNLYGENGNIKVLKKQLEEQGFIANIHFLTKGNKINFSKLDVIYIGSGTEENLKIAIEDILQYKEQIKKYIEDNKVFLSTGNSINMFGKYITCLDQTIIKTLEIFDYYIKEEPFRMVDESIFKCSLVKGCIIGFQNHNTTLRDNNDILFTKIKGIGSYPNSETEGVKYKNFYGTYLLGPLLARNPMFLEYIINVIIKSKYPKAKIKKLKTDEEKRAYDRFLKNFYESIIN